MEFRGFYKNTSMKRGDQMKVEVSRQNKIQRAKSRHEMRQAFRDMGCDSDEENEVEGKYDNFLQQQQQQWPSSSTLGETKKRNLSQAERYQIRVQRLQEFRERKRREQLEQRSKKDELFVPYVSNNIIEIEPNKLQPVKNAQKNATPLREWQESANQIPARTNKTPVLVIKYVKPRVDCWRTEQLPRKATDSGVPALKPASEKKAVPPPIVRPTVSKPALKQRAKETQPPAVVLPAKQVRHAVITRPAAAARPLSHKNVFKLKPPVADAGNSAKIVTSTARKHRKPLTFSFEHASEIKKPKATLTVNRAYELFDGISPIEVESSPLKPAIAVNGIQQSSPRTEAVAVVKKEESLWEPQPVACLSVHETTVHEKGSSVAAVAETKSKRDCSISDWVPAAVHEITSDSIIIVEDDDDGDDEVFEEAPHNTSNHGQEERQRKPTLNESFTVTKPAANESRSGCSVPSSDLATIIPHEPTFVRLSAEQMVQITGRALSDQLKKPETERPIQERCKSSPKANNLNGSTKGRLSSELLIESEAKRPSLERRKSSPKENKIRFTNGRVSSSPSNESGTKRPIQERRKSSPKENKIGPANGRVSFDRSKEPDTKQPTQERRNSSPKESKLNGSMIRKRASLIFTEQPIECEIVPSKSNLTLAEKLRLSLDDGKSSTSSPACPSDASQSSPDEPEVTKPPKEVEEKTRYYYDKVESELVRLQTLCDEFAPFLAEEQELNDHCRGLIIAAQGQTNILIKKKLNKFRELIGHYETKWNDRKVRHDDLDGFWVMLSLDLDNLDKRFEELRTLKANSWQEIVSEPKVKKLQAGGGVRKREKKPSAAIAKKSSGIADLIRKARQEAKLKQKADIADLDVLKETVTVVTTPVKRAVRFVDSPRRTSLRKRSSLFAGGTPTTVHWNQEPNTNLSKRHTIFPEITQSKPELVKSILKPVKVSRSRRAKSVLFLDDGLDTPQARRRHSSRTIVDTPKPKITFNEELEIEHIDNLAARTPSRLELEIQKRHQQSLLESASLLLPSSDDNDKDTEQQKKKTRKAYAQGTPCPDSGSVRRSARRASRCIDALFDGEQQSSNSCSDFKAQEESKGSAKRSTRASKNARKKLLED